MKKTRVIIMGHNYMTRLCMIRAFGQIGCEVYVICIYNKDKKKEPDFYSKYVAQYHFSKKNNETELISILQQLKKSSEKILLVPCSDFTAEIIDLHREELLPYYFVPGIQKEGKSVLDLMDKQAQKKIADRLEIKNAKSWTVKLLKGTEAKIPEGISYPCFPKASLSVSGGKKGMVRCDNERELKDALSKLQRGDCPIAVIEQFLTIDEEYALVGFSDGKNVQMPGILYLKQLAKGVHKGVAVSGELQPNTGYEKLLAQYKNYVLETGFVGLFDIDFFKCQGSFYFGEMNMRVGASCGAYIQAGVNLPEYMSDFYNGVKITSERPKIVNIHNFLNERMVIEDWYENLMSSKEMLALVTSKIGFLFDEDDCKPYRKFMLDVRKRQVKKVLKKILRR